MKKLNQLMEELGFRKDAPLDAKKSFIKNLIRQAYGGDVIELDDFLRNSKKTSKPKQQSSANGQLSFDFASNND